jgi:predicted unusual protein kinase regulating ubiquinone biosynthesis (AarF/ABC1/UbiB family)
VTELPRKAAVRTARLAALPLGYAGRQALGLGKRLGGKSAESVLTDVQQRTAEQLFRTLGELKGGAMKFGQALSVLEAALPEELIAPYRAHLTALQDSAPAMPAAMAYEEIEDALGADWRDQLVEMDETAAAAASIGQVHRGRWHDGREVAIKVQYPGAGDALLGDLRQLARVAKGVAPVFPGIDIKPLVAELQARAADELNYLLEAEAQQAFADAFRGDPEIFVPDVVAAGERVLVSEWMESPASLASVVADGTREERDHYGERLVRFLFAGPARTGMLHADPHPGNFRVLPAPDGSPGRLGVLDFGAVARLPERSLPAAMGRLMRLAVDEDPDALLEGLRREGFVKDNIRIEPQAVFDYLNPFVEPTRVERFRFTREWMSEQFMRIKNPRSPSYTIATKINLPPSYLLIHRTWLGGIGLLSQLEAEAPFKAILEESLPGFAPAAG